MGSVQCQHVENEPNSYNVTFVALSNNEYAYIARSYLCI